MNGEVIIDLVALSFFCPKDREEVDSGNIVDEQTQQSSDSPEISEDDSAANDPDYICEPDQLPEPDDLSDDLPSVTELTELTDQPHNLISGDNQDDSVDDPAVSIFKF